MSTIPASISIIIPSRNRRTYLLDLLDDLRRQSLPAAEVIVVDQSDEPYNLTDCRYLRDEGRGPVRARNLGIARAQGDLLGFLDDDTRVEPDFLANLCQPVLDGTASATCGKITQQDGTVYWPNRGYWRNNHTWWIAALTANPDTDQPGLTLSFPTGCAAIRASVIQSIGGFDPYFDPSGAGEDREIALRLFHHGHAIFYNPAAVVRHIGAPTGGRRFAGPPYVRYQDMNYLYIVAKYYGKAVYQDTCRGWLYSLARKNRGWNFRARLSDLRAIHAARKYIRRLDQLIEKNGWG